MQPEEKNLITGLFGRLQPYESQLRDPEAERLIAGLVQRQPATPYLLVQTALVQEQALKAAQDRIAELEGKAPPRQPGGFLGSAPRLGPWGARQQAGGPMPSNPMQGQPQGGGGSFLRSALATAAGVAGGALLFEGIRGLIGSHGSGPLAAQAAQPLMPPDQTPSGDQVSSADLAQDEGAADDYDLTADDSGFDSGGSDDL